MTVQRSMFECDAAAAPSAWVPIRKQIEPPFMYRRTVGRCEADHPLYETFNNADRSYCLKCRTVYGKQAKLF